MSGIVLDMAGACATITLDNPAKRNSLDLPMLERLAEVAREVAGRPDLAVVLLRGQGEAAFCAGADFDALAVPPVAETVATMDRALTGAGAALRAIPVPVVAAIRGACMGGGIELALAADIRVAAASARFAIPAARIGMAYPLPSLSRLIALGGHGAAALTLLTGTAFDADEARLRGLVDKVVPDDAFETELAAVAEAVAACDRAAVIGYKAILAALAGGDPAGARRTHDGLKSRNLFLPHLEAAIARRGARR